MGYRNNGWPKKPIDRMDMMHILGLVYAKTAAGFGRVGLCRFIRKEAKPAIQRKYTFVARAMIKSGLLIQQGCQGKCVKYRWNMKDFGPVSLLIADMMIAETENQIKIAAREKHANRKLRMNKTEEHDTSIN